MVDMNGQGFGGKVVLSGDLNESCDEGVGNPR